MKDNGFAAIWHPSSRFHKEGDYIMTVTAKAKVVAMKLPLVVEKDGVRYTCDIADDDKGVDLVVTKNKEVKNENEGEMK